MPVAVPHPARLDATGTRAGAAARAATTYSGPTSSSLDLAGLMTRALLVHPQFRSPSFWNYTATCELMGGRYPAAPLGLCTVAALLPADWEIRLLDRNVDDWDDGLLD